MNERKYVAFDIETAADIPNPDFNWRSHRPLGITCAAALPCDASEPIIWHGKASDGTPSSRMSRNETCDIVDCLCELVGKGYTLLTWNGLGFDLDVLTEESNSFERCKELALDHVDMMFHVMCDRGFPVALEKAAKAMELPGKPAGMSGFLAPQLWAQRRFQDVLNYVAHDVRISLQIAEACAERQIFRWITQRGTTASMPLRHGWLTVRDALRLPEPDTSWMSNPLPREDFTRWLNPK